jgi:hypothetical protein
MIDSTISYYWNISRLGDGGMGGVRGTGHPPPPLNALKFLPEDVAGDAHVLSRFRGELEAAFALNHPDIRTTYDISEASEKSSHCNGIIRI